MCPRKIRQVQHFKRQMKNVLPISESYIESFNQTLSDAIIKKSPTTLIRHSVAELPLYIIKLIKTRKKMYREYIFQKDPEDKRRINV